MRASRSEWSNRTILVTGGAGFVGSHVVEALLNQGDKVIVLDSVSPGQLRHIDQHNRRSFQVIKADISNYDFSQMSNRNITAVVHLAAEVDERLSTHRPLDFVNANVKGTVNLLEMLRNLKVPLVLASASDVYGSAHGRIAEDGPTHRPLSPYAATKMGSELMAHVYHHLYNVPVTILRLFPVYGPRGDESNCVACRVIEQVRRGDSIAPWKGSTSCDHTFVTDVADGVVEALTKCGSGGFTLLNIGQAASVSQTRLVQVVANIVENSTLLEEKEGDHSEVGFIANTTLARKDLQFAPKVSLEDGIQQTVAWFKNSTNQNVTLMGNKTHAEPRIRRRLTAMNGSVDFDWRNVAVLDPHMERKTVLLTGGAGFVGSHVGEALLKRGDRVIVVDEVNDYYDVQIKEDNLKLLQTYPNAVIYRGDIANKTLMEEIFSIERPEWICHLAARAGVRPSILDPYIYVHSNVRGTTELLELARKYEIRNFVFASSSSVYGGLSSTLFPEDARVDRPISPYAATKKTCELLAYVYHHLYGLHVTALRFFTVYGPRGRPDMAPFQFVDRVARGVELRQFGDGSSSRDYTYVDDIVDGVVRALDRPYDYQIFNLGMGSGTKLSDFIQMVQTYVGRSAKIKRLPDQPGDVPYTRADIQRAQRLLGYNPKVPFAEGIARTVEWYKATYPDVFRNETKQTSSSIPAKPQDKPNNAGPPGQLSSSDNKIGIVNGAIDFLENPLNSANGGGSTSSPSMFDVASVQWVSVCLMIAYRMFLLSRCRANKAR